MKIKTTSCKEYNPSFDDKFFLDSNVWLYLLFPQHSVISTKIIEEYSKLFEKITSQDCLIETNIVQISELVNLIIHLEHKVYNKKYGYIGFKDFRGSEGGKKALQNAKTLTSQILKFATLRDGIFNSGELKELVKQCDVADFNDLFFATFCKKESALLVTHDFDFNAMDAGIVVISANKNYHN